MTGHVSVARHRLAITLPVLISLHDLPGTTPHDCCLGPPWQGIKCKLQQGALSRAGQEGVASLPKSGRAEQAMEETLGTAGNTQHGRQEVCAWNSVSEDAWHLLQPHPKYLLLRSLLLNLPCLGCLPGVLLVFLLPSMPGHTSSNLIPCQAQLSHTCLSAWTAYAFVLPAWAQYF